MLETKIIHFFKTCAKDKCLTSRDRDRLGKKEKERNAGLPIVDCDHMETFLSS